MVPLKYLQFSYLNNIISFEFICYKLSCCKLHKAKSMNSANTCTIIFKHSLMKMIDHLVQVYLFYCSIYVFWRDYFLSYRLLNDKSQEKGLFLFLIVLLMFSFDIFENYDLWYIGTQLLYINVAEIFQKCMHKTYIRSSCAKFITKFHVWLRSYCQLMAARGGRVDVLWCSSW